MAVGPLSPGPLMAKRTLRQRIVGLRDAIDPSIRGHYSAMVADLVATLPEWERALRVHVFASFGSELDTRPIITGAIEAGKILVLPVVVRDRHELEHAVITGLDDLEPGYMGIPEPAARCPRVDPSRLDMVIVPGVAFDDRGGRLGYGGGYYDRFLFTCHAPRVAVCFGVQMVGTVPTGEHDLPVHVIVTEAGIIRTIPGTSGAR